MERGPPYDPRAIANLILEFSERASLPLRHIALQKLLYFAHAGFLVRKGRPLVSGSFEAWQYGPVHPAAYQAFKDAGDSPITFQATARDVLTGAEKPLLHPNSPDVVLHIMQIVSSYGRLSTGKLIELSHAPGGPWDFVTRQQGDILAYGGRITDDIISERFARPVASVKVQRDWEQQEPEREEDPTARNRPR